MPFSFLLHFLPALLPKNHTHIKPPKNFGNVHHMKYSLFFSNVYSFICSFVPISTSQKCLLPKTETKWNKNENKYCTNICLFICFRVFCPSSLWIFRSVVYAVVVFCLSCIWWFVPSADWYEEKATRQLNEIVAPAVGATCFKLILFNAIFTFLLHCKMWLPASEPAAHTNT